VDIVEVDNFVVEVELLYHLLVVVRKEVPLFQEDMEQRMVVVVVDIVEVDSFEVDIVEVDSFEVDIVVEDSFVVDIVEVDNFVVEVELRWLFALQLQFVQLYRCGSKQCKSKSNFQTRELH